MATKYSIAEADHTTEFVTYNEASDYKTAHSLSEDIVEVEYTESSDVALLPVTPRQIRQALILSGVSLSAIESALNSLSEPEKSLALVEWEYSIQFNRDRPIVISVSVMLGWTSEQLDALWILASTL